MEDFLSSDLFQYIVAAVVLYVLYLILAPFFRKKKVDKFMPKMRCRKCGWVGQVGKYDRNKACRKCGSSDLVDVEE